MMRRVISLYRTSVGKKFYMALSGVFIISFLVIHMAGNLKAFLGPDDFNHYANFYREVGPPFLPATWPLWIFRMILLVAVGLHMLSAWQVYLQSKNARGSTYKKEESLSFAYASRTMRWGGVIIGVFVVYHLMHFTVGNAHPEFIHGNAYRNMVIGFSNPLVVGFYAVATVMVAFHVYHGLWSAFQTMGANHPKYNGYRRPLALVLAILLFLGFMSTPLGVMTGRLSVEAGSSGAPAAEVHELNEGA
jgi:succinate dehydrogenase / fumarate reductase cytochrome b subunit